MNILAVYGSPNRNGNTATLINAILKGAVKSGHQIDRFYVNFLNIHNCMACENADVAHAEKLCNFPDDMTTKIIPKMMDCDVLILGSPIYMGQITGAFKNFIDRWYTFIEDENEIRIVNGKKFITVVTSGAPTDDFKNVSEYLDYWLSRFFKMEKIDQIHEGDMMDSAAAAKNGELLKKAEALGRSL